jgi:rifampicin phosphotransferase
MKKLPFAWLGSKRARKQGAGDKAGLLDIGRRLGLPVPEGVVLLHRLYKLLLAAEVIVVDQENGRIHCPDPHWLKQVLQQDVRLPPLDGPMVVRAAFCAANNQATNGQPLDPIPPLLNVDFDQPQAVADALCSLWTAVMDQSGTFRRDLIVQKPVSIRNEGVVFSDPAYQDDLVSVIDGQYSVIGNRYSVIGEQYLVNGEQWLLPQLRSGENVGSDLPEFARRLQMLLRGVRRTFGREAWRVEWADDGEICWLLQVNSLVDTPARVDQFVPLPLYGLPPARLTPQISEQIVTACADLHTLLRRLDKSLPDGRVLVKLDAEERPYINQSLLADTMRHWGLPTNPVHTLLGTEGNRSFGRCSGRVWRRGLLMVRLALRQLQTAVQAPTEAARWRQQAEDIDGEETAVGPTIAQLFAAALNAQLCLLGPISLDQPRIAQAQTIWQEEMAAAMQILCEKLVQQSNSQWPVN